MDIKGILPVVVTPMTSEGEIDEEGLVRLLNFLVEQRIGGLWVLGTGSEDMNLSFKKRLEIAKIATETVANRVPVILGAAFFAMEDIFAFIKETGTLRADAYHVMPYHPLLSPDRIEWFYTEIAENIHKPLWMYTSANWSIQLSLEIIAKLKSHPNIGGIKYSTSNAVDALRVISLADSEFQVITAVAGQTYQCLCMGSKSHTSSLASCLPEVLITIYELFSAGNHKEALQEQIRLLNFLDELPKGAKKDNFLMSAEEKYILSLRGICQEHTSSYYRALSKEEKYRIKKKIREYDIITIN